MLLAFLAVSIPFAGSDGGDRVSRLSVTVKYGARRPFGSRVQGASAISVMLSSAMAQPQSSRVAAK